MLCGAPSLCARPSSVLRAETSIEVYPINDILFGVAASRPKEILLARDSQSVRDALMRPEFSRYMSDLWKLEVQLGPEYRIDMLSSTCTQLEHICLVCALVDVHTAALSGFLGLRSVDFQIEVVTRSGQEGLPAVHGKGKLIVEGYDYDEPGEWLTQ
ncbi:hypothetical protein FB451DRAFT_1185930 [Mycena latifolia]|nr:hypothetical protein FB451DRAFT_1185930 [Mycena latifolia]